MSVLLRIDIAAELVILHFFFLFFFWLNLGSKLHGRSLSSWMADQG